MSAHRLAILAAPSIVAAQSILTDTLVKHPGISGKSYRRLVRAVESRTADLRHLASAKAAVTRARAASEKRGKIPIVVKPSAITKTRAKRELVVA